MRLMEINRRLATTRDPEALVEVILDSAVEFTGAERGLLLMPAGDGGLATASARDFYEGSVPEQHLEFSTSIARVLRWKVDIVPVVHNLRIAPVRHSLLPGCLFTYCTCPACPEHSEGTGDEGSP